MNERSKQVLALIRLNLDGFRFSADYQSGKKAELTSRVAARIEKGEAVVAPGVSKIYPDAKKLVTEDL